MVTIPKSIESHNPLRCAALVVGNGDYIDNPKLKNAVADAELIASKFKYLKYDVHLITNSTMDKFEDEFYGIIYSKPKYDVFILYFAGHGLMCQQCDYIVMTDAKRMDEHGGIPAQSKSKEITNLYKSIRNEGIPITIFIIDACRKDYSYGQYSTERGLDDTFTRIGKNINLEYQTFLAFSTSPLAGATDGKGNHSDYTQALADELLKPQAIEKTFKNVRSKLYKGPGSQLPWEHSCLVADFCFNHGQLEQHYNSPYYCTFTSTNSRLLFQYFEDSINELYGDNTTNLTYLSLFVKDIINNGPIPDQFILGRAFCKVLGNAKKDISYLMSKEFILSLFSGDENHFLNGIIYELYFDENDKYRGTTLSENKMIPYISRLCKFKEFKKSVSFITEELGNNAPQCYFLPGRKDPISVYIELNKDIIRTDCNKDIYLIDDIVSINGSIIGIFNNQPYTTSSLREAISNHLGIPQEDFECKFSRYGNNEDIYILTHLEENDIFDIIDTHINSHTLEDIDTCSHHYEYNSLDDFSIEDVSIEDESIRVKGSISINVTLYLDSEEEIDYTKSIAGHYSIIISPDIDKWLLVKFESLSFDCIDALK